MADVIVVFPKREIAVQIQNLLVRNGVSVNCVCTSGAQALHNAGVLDSAIVICGYKLGDMMYTELREYLPDTIEVLLIASPDKWGAGLVSGVVGLALPIKVYDLLDTLAMIQESMNKRWHRNRTKQRNTKLLKPQRTERETELINQAKMLLMERNRLTETEAHRYIQKSSMDNATNMAETARMILRLMAEE